MRNKIIIILVLIGLALGGFFWYRNFEKGKFLPKVDYKLLYPEGEKISFGIHFYCLGFNQDSKYDGIVINNEADYQQLIKEIENGCKNLVYPKIDFNSETLIGAYTVGSCGAYFEHDVRRDDDEKLIRYIIDVKSRSCHSGPGNRSLNLIVIPRVPKGYGVQFEIYPKPQPSKIVIYNNK